MVRLSVDGKRDRTVDQLPQARRSSRAAGQAATFTMKKTAGTPVLSAGPGRVGDRTGKAGVVRLSGRNRVLHARLGPRHRDNRPTGRSSGFRLVAIPGQPSPGSVQHRAGVASRPGLWPITAAALRRIRTGFPLRPPDQTGRTCREWDYFNRSSPGRPDAGVRTPQVCGSQPPCCRPRAVAMSCAAAHWPRSRREMAAAIRSGKRSGVQAKTGMPRSAIRWALPWS